MQLMHPFVQKWTTTTLPFWSASLSGFEFIHSVTPMNSGAATVLSLSAVDPPGSGYGPPAWLNTTQSPAVKPISRMSAIASLLIIAKLRKCVTDSKSRVPVVPTIAPIICRPLVLKADQADAFEALVPVFYSQVEPERRP